MKPALLLTVFFLLTGLLVNAQQKLDPKGMNYVLNPKPSSVIYHDTLYSGSKQFAPLFERTGDPELMIYLKKHKSNKVTGLITNIASAIITVVGIDKVSNSDSKGFGWALIGAGFCGSLASGYLQLMSQKNLVEAVRLFNQKYNHASLGIGIDKGKAGLVYNF